MWGRAGEQIGEIKIIFFFLFFGGLLAEGGLKPPSGQISDMPSSAL